MNDDELKKFLRLIEVNDVGRLAEAIRAIGPPQVKTPILAAGCACRRDIPGPSLVYETCSGCSTETQAIEGAHAHARCLVCGAKWVEAGSAAFPTGIRHGGPQAS